MLEDKLKLCGGTFSIFHLQSKLDASLTDIIIAAFNHKPKLTLQEIRTITSLSPVRIDFRF